MNPGKKYEDLDNLLFYRKKTVQEYHTIWSYVIAYSFLVLVGIFTLIPILSICFASFKSPMEVIYNGGLGLPRHWQWSNFSEAWLGGNFHTYFINSVLVALTVTIGGLTFSLFCAYALAITRVPGRNFWLLMFMVGLIIPVEGVIIPLYYQIHGIKLINTLWALVLPQIAMSISFGAFYLRQVLLDIPGEILDCAKIDGCNNTMLLFKVVIPLIKSTLSALTVFFLMWTWNEFLLPLVLTYSESLRTLPIGLALFQGKYTSQANLIAAGTVIVSFPMILAYVFFQHQFIEGITAGSIKG